MRGGGIGATLEAFPVPLGSSDILSNMLIAAASGRPPPIWSAPTQMSRCVLLACGARKGGGRRGRPEEYDRNTYGGVRQGKFSTEFHWNAECVKMM